MVLPTLQRPFNPLSQMPRVKFSSIHLSGRSFIPPKQLHTHLQISLFSPPVSKEPWRVVTSWNNPHEKVTSKSTASPLFSQLAKSKLAPQKLLLEKQGANQRFLKSKCCSPITPGAGWGVYTSDPFPAEKEEPFDLQDTLKTSSFREGETDLW